MGASDAKSVLIPEEQLPELPRELSGEPSQAGTAALRGRVVAGWLLDLEPRTAPVELEGCVVAAMNPGYQQERAVASLARLCRHSAPASLELRVAAHVLRADPQAREVAPAELDRLVEERVLEPEAALVRDMSLRLDVVQAPAELESRVERQLLVGRGGHLGSVRSIAAACALAAGVLLSLWIADPAAAPSSNVHRVRSATVASSDQPIAVGHVMTTASGLSFRVIRVTDDTMTETDRVAIQALGLPPGAGS